MSFYRDCFILSLNTQVPAAPRVHIEHGEQPGFIFPLRSMLDRFLRQTLSCDDSYVAETYPHHGSTAAAVPSILTALFDLPDRLSRPCLPLNNHPGTFSSRGGVWTKIRLRPFVTCLFVICYFTVAFAMLEYPPTRVQLVMDL